MVPAEAAYELKITVVDSGGAYRPRSAPCSRFSAASERMQAVVTRRAQRSRPAQPASCRRAFRRGYPARARPSTPHQRGVLGYRIGDESERALRTHEEGVGACRDYEHKSGTLNLGGRTSATLEVRPLHDACPGEPEEFVYIEFFDPVEVTLDANTLGVSISDVHSKMGLVDSRASTEEGNLLPLSVAEGKVAAGDRSSGI